MLLANYNFTDRLHAFFQYSYLSDQDWMVTGIFQHLQEFSTGMGYEFYPGFEVRGEYRHDLSSATGNLDSVSIHLAFAI